LFLLLFIYFENKSSILQKIKINFEYIYQERENFS